MTDERLIAACRELQHLRDRLRDLADREKLIAGDVVAELAERKLDFFVFDPSGLHRAVLECPETREVNEQRFLAACRALEMEADAVAACFTRRISVTSARKLLDGQVAFDGLCDAKPGKPRVRIISTE